MLSSNVHLLDVTKVHSTIPNFWDHPRTHLNGPSSWTDEEVHGVKQTHVTASRIADYIALGAVKACRFTFDSFTWYKWGTLTEKKVINRAIFLETVAAVPGMVRKNRDRDLWFAIFD